MKTFPNVWGSAPGDRFDRPPARKRKVGMNGTEQKFADLLESWKRKGNISWWGFEPIRLKLAERTTYTPDFVITNQEIGGEMMPDTITAYEIKGFWRDDARVKIKVAAKLFPWIRFVAVKLLKGAWAYEEIPG